jgi:hypothetical protein
MYINTSRCFNVFLDLQVEFLSVGNYDLSVGTKNFEEGMQVGSETYHYLKVPSISKKLLHIYL